MPSSAKARPFTVLVDKPYSPLSPLFGIFHGKGLDAIDEIFTSKKLGFLKPNPFYKEQDEHIR